MQSTSVSIRTHRVNAMDLGERIHGLGRGELDTDGGKEKNHAEEDRGGEPESRQRGGWWQAR